MTILELSVGYKLSIMTSPLEISSIVPRPSVNTNAQKWTSLELQGGGLVLS